MERLQKFLHRSQMYLKAHLVLLASFHFAHKTSLPLRMTCIRRDRRPRRSVNPRSNACIRWHLCSHSRAKRRILRGNKTNVTFTSKRKLPPPRTSAPPWRREALMDIPHFIAIYFANGYNFIIKLRLILASLCRGRGTAKRWWESSFNVTFASNGQSRTPVPTKDTLI